MEIQSISSNLRKNKSYDKLSKGKIILEGIPDFSNEISKKKREEFGKFVFDSDQFENTNAETKDPVLF